MSDLFDEEDDLVEGEFVNTEDEVVDIDVNESTTLDARRRLENMLEEKRLRDELDDFVDY
ncbi:hypothetical protein BN59_01183 [Legionella massiliensis]|uniref:Uncharacterized protein n=1 Tax=Legionella massiliensis TaxID=1034943 RepID=A0A078KYR3_9GAMM|nr:hypothetical protein [Legionella massiliensis]CDZ76904.1 hypothetical protein BN59_01183 [Legionella massiliensis]CEE12642.1 hypothetical protein BN1094_01183 [Legionella massiliensis]